jgi:hypothetical protein
MAGVQVSGKRRGEGGLGKVLDHVGYMSFSERAKGEPNMDFQLDGTKSLQK